MAQNGHASPSAECPLSGVKRTSISAVCTSALCQEADMQSELAAGSGRHLADQVGTSYLPAARPYGRMKNARDAAAITAVAAQPQIAIDRDSVSRPITLGLRTISIITAISGAASTPLTTAAQ